MIKYIHTYCHRLAIYILKRLEILRLCSKVVCKYLSIYSYNCLNIKCDETSCYNKR